MNLARKLCVGGAVSAVLFPKNGFYEHGLPKGMKWRYRLRSLVIEIALRARLFVKGAWRGLQGTGVIGVGRLYASVIRAHGAVEHFGLVCTRAITDAGVAFIVDDWDGNVTDITNFNYHGVGTGVTAEAANQTALVTECTTALNPDSTRATGTKSQPSANVMRSVGTLTFDAATAVTEHAVLSQAATGGGTMLDRSVFATINVNPGDSIQFTYDCTLSSGG